jgi:hypothetical protein
MKALPHSRPKAQAPPRPARSRRRVILHVLAGLLLAVGATGALLEFFVGERLPARLVGKWVVVEGQLEGATLEFGRDGSLVGRAQAGPGESVLKGHLFLEDRTLYVTLEDPVTRQEKTVVHTVRLLNRRRLVLEDEEGRLLKLERAEE